MDKCPISGLACSKNKTCIIQTPNMSQENIENIKICTECAGKQLFNFLSKILVSDNKEKDISDKVCSGCQTKLSEIIKKSRFGCPICYSSFKEEVQDILSSCQAGTKHVGKKPKKIVNLLSVYTKDSNSKTLNLEPKIELLQKELNEAIVMENYEKAAILKKSIDKLRTMNDSHEAI